MSTRRSLFDHYFCAGGAMLEAFCLGSVIVDGPAWCAAVYTLWLIMFLKLANDARGTP